MLRVSNSLWIISDTHLGHQNIIKFQQRPRSHELIMLSNWVDRVKETDQILHMGDVVVKRRGAPLRWLKLVGRLPGEKFLIKGNHDLKDDEPYLDAGFTIIDEFMLGAVAFTHRPVSEQFPGPTVGKDWQVNIHGHTHSNDYNPKHDGVLDKTKTYINVCVEHTGLAPIQLGQIYPFKNWYAQTNPHPIYGMRGPDGVRREDVEKRKE
jgi:calcineurin-like phosphoesterase family protein